MRATASRVSRTRAAGRCNRGRASMQPGCRWGRRRVRRAATGRRSARRGRWRLRALARQRLREFGAQVRVEAPRVDVLQALEHRVVHALRPEREPVFITGALTCVTSKFAATIARSRARGSCVPPRGGAWWPTQVAQHVPHRRFEQAVLVAEVVADDARRDVRALRDRRERRAGRPLRRSTAAWRRSTARGVSPAFRLSASRLPSPGRAVHGSRELSGFIDRSINKNRGLTVTTITRQVRDAPIPRCAGAEK